MSLTPALFKFLCSSAVSDPLGFTVCFLRQGGPAISGTARPVGRTCARRARIRRVRVPSARASRRLGSGTLRRRDRRGPAGAPRGPGRARRPLPELRPGGRAGGAGAGARSGPGPRAARSLRACRAGPL